MRITGTAAVVLAGLAPATAAAASVEAMPPPHPPVVTAIAPGISYQRAVRTGGQVVDIVRARRSPRVSLAPVLPGGSTIRRGSLQAAVRAREGEGVVAGLNGDFFSYRTGDPSGALIIDRELFHEPEPARSAAVLLPGGGLEALALALQGSWTAVDAQGNPIAAPHPFGGLNRPAKRGSETILFTRALGRPATPIGPSLFEVRVRLDAPGPVVANVARSGTAVARGPGGGMPIGPRDVVLAGVGPAGVPLADELPLGTRVTILPAIADLPGDALDAIGGGPALVRDGLVLSGAGEGFSAGQLGSRTTRSALGRRADGTLLLVTAEGPAQGSPGLSVSELARVMVSLGAQTAVAMDAGGSAQMVVDGSHVVPWTHPRALADALLLRYEGVTLAPLPARISANGDRVDDRAIAVIRAPRAGIARVTIAKRGGRPARRVWEGRLGPGTRRVAIDPRRLRLGDGIYQVVAVQRTADGDRTTQRRRVILDRTLAALTARPQATRRRGRVIRRVEIGFRLLRGARVSVRITTPSGRPLRTLMSGRRLRAGRHLVRWNRRARGGLVSGPVRIGVEARGRLGRSGLIETIRLATPRHTPPRGARG